MNNNKKILLHVCCATCGAGCVMRLKECGFEEIVLFEYNPNIFPTEEHQKRCQDIRRLSEEMHLDFLSLSYDHEKWLKEAASLEKEKEGGKRCDVCFGMRLRETAREAKRLGIPFITTTLSVSPHKNFDKIKEIGEKEAKRLGLEFYPENFKKKDGFKKSLELSRGFHFYRQNYCGCEFSMKKNQK
ncbi:MAG: epoxyqueuosine reductase QueH [Candidatus Aureabacteria bacterium]|nr:epoxyqueuosine reductase QueH [Candidatus Auribacterota bacterium]